eukprot:jgi/Mesen1/3456/ME000194S02599
MPSQRSPESASSTGR